VVASSWIGSRTSPVGAFARDSVTNNTTLVHDFTTTCDSSLVIVYGMSSANAVTKISSDADADLEIDLGGKTARQNYTINAGAIGAKSITVNKQSPKIHRV
jgi:hypothetical protein